MWKIYLSGLRFKAHLSLLYSCICARTALKTEGSRYTSPVLRTGRLIIDKRHANVHYCQSSLIGCNHKIRGAKSSVKSAVYIVYRSCRGAG